MTGRPLDRNELFRADAARRLGIPGDRYLPPPMLTVNLALPPGWAAEPKWDGYLAQLAR
ncbi:hypothetical protein [Streptomyces sp. NPDC048256]|uniref:hypothetical protein n=1 Tax=unclassified Streptomyces TaxID=2593676 RepID=UPI003404EC7E